MAWGKGLQNLIHLIYFQQFVGVEAWEHGDDEETPNFLLKLEMPWMPGTQLRSNRSAWESVRSISTVASWKATWQPCVHGSGSL